MEYSLLILTNWPGGVIYQYHTGWVGGGQYDKTFPFIAWGSFWDHGKFNHIEQGVVMNEKV